MATTADRAPGARSAGRGSGDGPERVTVNLSGRASHALEIATGITGDTKTDAINKALLIYAFLEQVMARGGSVYAREAAESELERLRLF
jgi:hypothetical protein